MTDDFELDLGEDDKAVIELQAHFFDEQNKQILWGRMSETLLRWYKNRPPEEPGEMVEIVGVLGTITADYYREYCASAYEAIDHTQRLLAVQEKVSDFLSEQLYHAHKGKKF